MIVKTRTSYYERDGILGEKYGGPKHYLFRKGDIEKIEGKVESPCCPDMELAIGDEFIGFGEFDSILNSVKAMCLYQCSPFPEGASWDEMHIEFCPFCGEKIILEEASEQ